MFTKPNKKSQGERTVCKPKNKTEFPPESSCPSLVFPVSRPRECHIVSEHIHPRSQTSLKSEQETERPCMGCGRASRSLSPFTQLYSSANIAHTYTLTPPSDVYSKESEKGGGIKGGEDFPHSHRVLLISTIYTGRVEN